MATLSCSIIGYKFYNGGWSSWKTSLTGGYAGKTKYVVLLKLKAPQMINSSSSFSLTIPWVRQSWTAKSGVIYARLYSSEPTSFSNVLSETVNSPHGSVSWNTSSVDVKTSTITFNTTSIVSNSTFYISLGHDSDHIQIGYPGYDYLYSSSVTYNDTYNISYNANGGSGSQAAGLKNHGAAYPLPVCTFSPPAASSRLVAATFYREGGIQEASAQFGSIVTTKSFSNWRLNSASGTIYGVGTNYTTNASATFYASWQESMAYPTITLPTPYVTGYTFKHWKLGSNTYVGGSKYQLTSDTIFYSVWERQSFELRLYANDGSSTYQSRSVGYGLTSSLNFYTPSRIGYKFKGWAESSNATIEQYKSNHIMTLTDNKYLYAVWEPYTLTVHYYGNGATSGTYKGQELANPSGKVLTVTYKYDIYNGSGLYDVDNKDYLLLTRTNYRPTQNWTNSDGSKIVSQHIGYKGQELAAALGVDISSSPKEIDVYAEWVKSPFKLTYQVYNKTYEPTEPITDKSQLLNIKDVLGKGTIEKSLIIYDKFDGWSINNQLITDLASLWTSIEINAEDGDGTINSVRKITLTAKTSARYKIVYYNGSTYKELTPITYDSTNKFKRLKLGITV